MAESRQASILDELAEIRKGKETPCIVGRALDELDPENREAIVGALDGRSYSPAQIAVVLNRRVSEPLSERSVFRHRNRVCPCFRKKAS